jgi:hypothetical protein
MMSDVARAAQIAAIAALPDQLRALVAGLDDATLTTVLVPGEWTVAQNVHHLADSHAQAFNRARLILTEAHPTITPYDQDAWARLPEAMAADLTIAADPRRATPALGRVLAGTAGAGMGALGLASGTRRAAAR